MIVAEPPKPKAAAVVVDAPQQQPKPVPVVVETPQQPKYVPIVEAPQQPKPVVVMEEVPAPRPVAVDEIVQPKLAQPKSFIVTEQPTKPASKPFPFVSAPKKVASFHRYWIMFLNQLILYRRSSPLRSTQSPARVSTSARLEQPTRTLTWRKMISKPSQIVTRTTSSWSSKTTCSSLRRPSNAM